MRLKTDLLGRIRNNNSLQYVKDIKLIDVAGGIDKSRTVNLSEIADSIEYIPLETSREAIIGKIFYDMIFFENGLLYISLQNESMKIFNDRGKYINTINKKGRGPGEYEQFRYIDINYVTGNIYIEGYEKIIEYNKNGDYIRTINFPKKSEKDNLRLYFFRNFNNYNLMASNVNQDSKYSAVILDSTSKIIKKIKYPIEEREYIKSMARPYGSTNPRIFKYGNKIRLINGHNKYILGINEDLSVDTAFVINYGEYDTKLKSMTQLKPNSPYLWHKFNVYESDDYLFTMFHVGSLLKNPTFLINPNGKQYNYYYACSFYKKETGEFSFIDQPKINQLGFIDDFEGGPAVWPKYISYDNYMISIIAAYDFKAFADNNKVSRKYHELADNLKDSDNYILVKVKLKKTLE